MDPGRWQEIERLYHEAQVCPAAVRAAFLAEACAGDEGLRREVQALLDEPATTEGFLDRPALIGRRLGVYHIQERIGAGGMGEVYRARDTRLGRDVAIKILPPVFTADPGRLARFEREARVLAALNHPNIATIHGVEDNDGVHALVLELVEGETLAERIARGPCRVADAATIATQIADALDSAHEKGIVHRDLKPANIKITPAGTVKVLDFGLAKATGGAHPDERTLTAAHTREGVIVGTASYMSPEQARGLDVDKRTDIWAFGCVVYEMLTGRAPFAGDTSVDTIAAVLDRQPAWDALPSATPPTIRRLLVRSLEKDPRQRLRDIGDARADLADAAVPATASGNESTGRRPDIWRIVAVAALGGVVVLSLVIRDRPAREGDAPASVTRTTLTIPANQELETAAGAGTPVLSPDGRRLAYVARTEGRAQLYLRELDAFAPTLVTGSDGADDPFFSPDGQSVAFFADGKLKRASVLGGAPVPICDAPPGGRGGAWSADGMIVFDPGESGLLRVPATGGRPEPLTTRDPAMDARDLSWPSFLPGGRGLVVTAGGMFANQLGLSVLDVVTGEWRPLAPGSQAQYVNPGYLVYHAPHVREGELHAAAFDLESLSLGDAPFSVVESVFRAAGGGAAYFSASQAGHLVFAAGGLAHTLVRVDRNGRRTPLLTDRRGFRFPRLSPDGTHVALTIDPRPSQIWVYNLERQSGIPLATGSHSLSPMWTPDGRGVLYSSGGDINRRAAGAGTAPERVLARDRPQYPSGWSPDGDILVFSDDQSTGQFDIWMLPPNGDARTLIATPAHELNGTISPNGKWLAYNSDEAGRREVYVRPFPDVNRGKWTVSAAGGGHSPLWSRDGREPFYMNGAALMAVAVDVRGGSFAAGTPVALFSGPFDTTQDPNYDVFPDGQHFVMVEADPDSRPTRLQVVLNWSEELKRREAVSGTGR